MDVRCEHCRTEYEFDDAKITEAGVTVKCTVCNHVFKVKRKSLYVTEPIKPGALEAAPPPPQAPAPPTSEKPREREWKVRQSNGNVFSFKELTTLQKWIVERKVSRDDEISLTGEAWKRLGNIAELASFFQVVEAADRAAAMAAAPAALYGAPASSPPPAVYSPGFGAPAPVPIAPAAPPAPIPASRLDTEPDAADLAAIRGGGKARYAIGAVVFGALVGAGLFFKLSGRPASTPAPALAPAVLPTPQPVPVAAPLPTPMPAPEPTPTPTPTAAPAEPQKPAEPAVAVPAEPAPPTDTKPAPLPDEKPAAKPDEQLAAKPDAKPTPAPEDKPAEPKPPAARPEGGTPAGKSYDWYIQQAFRLRGRNQAAAALGHYEKAIELNPESAEPLAGKAYCLVDLGRVDEAIGLFQEALQRHPRYLEAIMGLAESHKERGDTRKAVEYYKRYVDQAPDGPEADVARANLERLKE